MYVTPELADGLGSPSKSTPPNCVARIRAPAGLFATAEERAVLAGGDGRFMRDERETTRTGGGP